MRSQKILCNDLIQTNESIVNFQKLMSSKNTIYSKLQCTDPLNPLGGNKGLQTWLSIVIS